MVKVSFLIMLLKCSNFLKNAFVVLGVGTLHAAVKNDNSYSDICNYLPI